MTKRKPGNSDTTDLRNRALRAIGDKPASKKTIPALSETKYRQELNIHQVELEMQNEELRAARVQLEMSLDRYTQLFDFAPIAYATLGADSTVRELNHFGAGLLYESRARLIGKRFANFIAAHHRASFDELILQALASEQKETRELELIRIGGERPMVRISAVSLAGTVPTILLAFEDVTNEKRAEERLLRADAALREADRRKDEFIAVLSHELRTPLSTLLMYGQLLRQGNLDDDKIRMAAEAIERAARAQTRLVDDLLDVSRIVAGKLKMQVEKVNIAGVARAAVDTVRSEAEQKRVQLIIDLDSSTPTVLGDVERLRQAIINLLTNAIKFTPAEGQVSVSVEEVEHRVEVKVRDTGSGIDPEFVPRLFERFSQADRTLTRSTRGLGLGLSIVRSIVDAHHGTIRATSPGRGKGSTFTISLPIGVAPNSAFAAPTRPPSSGEIATIKGKRLLVVEDDDSTRETLIDVLTLAGADVRGANGSPAAMHLLTDFRPDVLLCDIAMPEEDGCSLLRRIRARGASDGGEVRALALTAFASDEDRARTRAAGFATHLVKPVDIDQLIAAVSELLPQKDARATSSA